MGLVWLCKTVALDGDNSGLGFLSGQLGRVIKLSRNSYTEDHCQLHVIYYIEFIIQSILKRDRCMMRNNESHCSCLITSIVNLAKSSNFCWTSSGVAIGKLGALHLFYQLLGLLYHLKKLKEEESF